MSEIKGVGSERLAQLHRLDLRTIDDLLRHQPRRYEDRRHFLTISQLALQQAASTRGRIVAMGLKRWKHGARSVFEIVLEDGSARLHCRWWNLPFMQNYFKTGDDVFVFGKLNGLKPRTMDHPETEVIVCGEERSIHMERIAPVYPLTEGLPQRWMRALLWRVLDESREAIGELWKSSVPVGDPLAGLPLPSRAHAIQMLHFPQEIAEVEQARRKLAFDELVALQFAIQNRRRELEKRARGLPCAGNNQLMKPFLGALRFKLTDSQTSVLKEVRHDLGGRFPMRRLLQGDVGSGKTMVAACASLMAIESGFDVALMAPTEILAEQHFRNFRRWFAPLGVPVQLLVGASRGRARGGESMNAEKASVPADGRPPRATFWVGTHALIESGFSPGRLGLVIIDEQHKFGVAQRDKLLRKGHYPHLLVMTATPIPRTLGLTVYGDLDISIILHAPAGRGAVTTFVRAADKLGKVHEFIRKQLAQGRQAYIVYPRIAASEDTDLKAVEKEFKVLQREYKGYGMGLLHGRIPPAERDGVMESFAANRLQLLLATSVIEVGVDVPNATVMLIENAEHFGLAQLHQLRGRIGRGIHESFCILIAAAKTEESRQRLSVLETTHDGFEIAEQDLRIRGPGELVGREQSGGTALLFADLEKDAQLLERARALVRENLKLK